jgi:Ni/Co efflux regulator RcnB
MNNKTIIAAVLAITVSSAGAAYAQGKSDRDDHKDRGRGEQGQGKGQSGHTKHDNRDDRNDRSRGDQAQRNGHPGQHDNRNHAMQRDHHGERGAGPNHNYYKGQALPAQYRHRNYVVDDWRSHRLSAPPRGYHWVQTGSDYVLVAIATGIIFQLFLN